MCLEGKTAGMAIRVEPSTITVNMLGKGTMFAVQQEAIPIPSCWLPALPCPGVYYLLNLADLVISGNNRS